MPQFGIQDALNRLRYSSAGEPANFATDSERINAIIDVLRALARGENIEVPRGFKDSAEGKVFLDFSIGGGGGVSNPDHPFKGIAANKAPVGETPGEARVRVIFGTVNSVVPNIMDADTEVNVPLDGTTGDPSHPPRLLCEASGGIWLQTVWTGDEPFRAVTSADIVWYASESPPADTDDYAYYLLANVTVEDSAVTSISQAVTHSLFVQRVKCGGTAQYYWNGV